MTINANAESLMFVPQLRAIQERCGYLPPEEINDRSSRLDVPLHRLHEVISFFPHVRREPPPEVEVRVCRDQACHLRGAADCRLRLEDVAADLGGPDRVRVEGVSCLGRCDGAPAVLIELHRKGYHDQARVVQRGSIDECAARLRDRPGSPRWQRDPARLGPWIAPALAHRPL